MTQTATVTRILNGGMAEIAVRRKSACGGICHACGGCSDAKIVKVSAKNSASAAVGDEVIVSSETSGILKAAFVVYIIPIILFFAFYAAAAAMAMSEGMCIGLSIVGFVIGVIIAVIVNSSIKKRGGSSFEIIRIIGV